MRSYIPFLSVTPFVCFKTSEPQELGASKFKCDYIFIYREYLLTYAAGDFFFQIWILCQNSLIRELKIRVVGFVLKKLVTFFEILIVPHALYCIDGCFFVFYLI